MVKRMSFHQASQVAKRLGFILQDCRGGYEYWKPGQDHTIGEARTLAEAVQDMESW